MARCYSTKHPHYDKYGGDGVRVCKRWRKFENFLTDMGVRPVGTVLDRDRAKKVYNRKNCQWVTYKESTANRRITVFVKGERILDMAARLGIPAPRIARRLARGWSKEQIELHPQIVYGKRHKKKKSGIPARHIEKGWRERNKCKRQ